MAKIEMHDVTELKRDDLFINSKLPFPTYFLVAGQFVLYKPNGAEFNEKDLDRLNSNNIKYMYIPKEFTNKYSVYLDENVSKILVDTKVPVEKKSQYLLKNASNVVKDIFGAPENPQNFVKSQALVKNFVDYIKQGVSAFHSLISLSMHDFYTYTHSVGVMTYAIALASQTGISAKQTLEDLGMAGLLHDVGKSKIPNKIINKPGPLDPSEWEVMKLHVTYSHEIALQYNKLPEVTLTAIKQHHETPLGTGYPDGIKGSDLQYYSKIISVCDIYSALTTDRPYSKGRPSFEALQIMKTIADKGQIDKNLFQALILMLKS